MAEIQNIINQADSLVDDLHIPLNLSANENSMSHSARRYLSSAYSDRYYFESTLSGYADFPEFVAAGAPKFDSLLDEAKQMMKSMFAAEYVNLYPLSGIHAMLMVMLTLTEINDGIASLSPQMHGHFATANVVARIGRKQFNLPTTEIGLDLDTLKEFVTSNKIKLIYLDVMSAQQPFDVSAIRNSIGDEVLIVYDASHTLGLIAGNAIANPLNQGADVICGNTHKTFPGPHRGIILAKHANTGNLIDKHGSNLYSSVQANTLLALIITIHEMNQFGAAYAKKIIQNAQVLQKALLDSGVIEFDSGITENHQVHIIKRDRQKAKELLHSLKDRGISSHLCYSKDEGFFVRVGTQEITRRGMGTKEMHEIASLIEKTEQGIDISNSVSELQNRFQRIKYSFDK